MLLSDFLEDVCEAPAGGLASQLRELEKAAWLAGNPALLYCGACEAEVSPESATEGPLRDWPYCPIHEDKPLTIHSASPLPQESRRARSFAR